MIISTVWEVITYDVWGNKRDGFEVNQVFNSGMVEIPVKLEVYNPGKEWEFYSGGPTDTQIRKALGITPRVRIYDPYSNEGIVYANHVSTDYPLGELRLVSHDSLSFSPNKVITNIRWSKTNGKLYPVFKQANGDDFMDKDVSFVTEYECSKAEIIQHATGKLKAQGCAIPRKYLELNTKDF